VINLFKKNLFFCLVSIALITLGSIRSSPLYGKIDFFFVEGKPWWPAWKNLITQTREKSEIALYTDYVTAYVLAGVYGEKPLIDVEHHKTYLLTIENMARREIPPGKKKSWHFIREKKEVTTKCVINTIGYEPSWVPGETKHWNHSLSYTARYYRYKDTSKNNNITKNLADTHAIGCSIF
jgi:hypothetical protein